MNFLIWISFEKLFLVAHHNDSIAYSTTDAYFCAKEFPRRNTLKCIIETGGAGLDVGVKKQLKVDKQGDGLERKEQTNELMWCSDISKKVQ